MWCGGGDVHFNSNLRNLAAKAEAYLINHDLSGSRGMDQGVQTNTWEITSEGKPIDVHEVNAEEEQLAEEETSV